MLDIMYMYMNTIRSIINKLSIQGTLLDFAPLTWQRNVWTVATTAAVSENVAENPELSIWQWSQQFSLYSSIMWKNIWKDLGLHPYKMQSVKELKRTR